MSWSQGLGAKGATKLDQDSGARVPRAERALVGLEEDHRVGSFDHNQLVGSRAGPDRLHHIADDRADLGISVAVPVDATDRPDPLVTLAKQSVLGRGREQAGSDIGAAYTRTEARC
jgi:hypothetical protein